ncbi:MAG TPA: hypothetical protein VG944_05820 [Fimbriimonas sp.]|nr:hypothetical protein [Fimbriimonas sp.]
MIRTCEKVVHAFRDHHPGQDQTESKARLTTLTKQLSAHPEMALDIPLSGESEDAAIQAMFSRDHLAHITKSDSEIDAGDFFTVDQVDEHFAKKTSEWNRQSQP